jgi:hypothetical protein
MPDYDISDETRTRVTIIGEIINDNYAHQLKMRPELKNISTSTKVSVWVLANQNVKDK